MDKLIKFLISLILRIPVVGTKLKTSSSFVLGQIGFAFSSKDYRGCLDLIYASIEYEPPKIRSNDWIWWEIIRYSVLSAAKLKNANDYKHISDILSKNINPLKDRSVAETLIKLSQLAFYFQDLIGAKKYAMLSIEADEKWGEGEFLLGWYNLPTEESIEYFKSAINKDKKYLKRIQTDDKCLEYPEILKHVS